MATGIICFSGITCAHSKPPWTLTIIYLYINWIGKPLPKWEADWQPSKSTKDQWVLRLLAFVLLEVIHFGTCKALFQS